MNVTTENTARATAITSPIRPPRTLEELLDREEALAASGIERGVGLLGGDLRDAIDLRLHLRRNPFKTSAIVGAIGFLAAAYAKRSKRGKRRRGSWLTFVMRSLMGTGMTGALAARIGRSMGWSRER